MRNRLPRTNLRGLRALASLLVALSSAIARAVVPIPSATPPLTPVVINASAGDQYDPHISGNLVSYTSDLEIRYFDFSTNVDTAIPLDASARDLLSDVSGTQIVFSRVITGVATAAVIFDTATSNTIELDPAPGTTRIGSAIGGDTVAYIDFGLEGHGELVAHDLATSTSRRLTNDAAYDANPSVSPSGAVITWEHCATSSSNCNIWQAVNTGASWAASVTTATANPEANPDTNGALVVYDSLRAGQADIFMKPVAGGPEIRLEHPGFDANPSIAGDYILFESRPTLFATTDIFVYDTLSNRVFRVTNTPLVTEQLNDIAVLPDGRIRAVWASDEDSFDQRNIHAATFTLPRGEAAWSWGLNSFGQLGDGTLANRASPVRIAGLTVTALAGGHEHSLALLSDGTVWAWGLNDLGQLGDATNTNRLTPVQVPGLSGVTAIAGGDDHSLALKSDGSVWAWGHNNHGQLGDATFNDSTAPVHVYRLTDPVTGIAAGSEHSLAITSRMDPSCPPQLPCVIREVFAWGEGRLGRLGDGADQTSEIPVQVVGLTNVAAVAAGNAHSLALKLDGTLWSWGLNDNGQLGDGTNSNASTPVQVIAYPGTAIAARGNHSLAISTIGCPSFACAPAIRVSAWGDNAFGQLGDGTLADSNLPILVTGLTNAAAIAAGGEFSLAKRTDGSLWAWGSNVDGKLGDGTGADSSTPVQVELGRVLAIGAGGSHGLASGTRECADGLDNDRDGKTDFQLTGPSKDYGCASANDPSETGTVACDDGIDNDGDGLFDFRVPGGGGDIGCSSHRSTIEAPQCQDGIDNDLQPGIDFDGGASTNGGSPLAATDPQCTAPTGASEAPAVPGGGCGVGPELALMLPLLGAARARRRPFGT